MRVDAGVRVVRRGRDSPGRSGPGPGGHRRCVRRSGRGRIRRRGGDGADVRDGPGRDAAAAVGRRRRRVADVSGRRRASPRSVAAQPSAGAPAGSRAVARSVGQPDPRDRRRRGHRVPDARPPRAVLAAVGAVDRRADVHDRRRRSGSGASGGSGGRRPGGPRRGVVRLVGGLHHGGQGPDGTFGLPRADRGVSGRDAVRAAGVAASGLVPAAGRG